MTQSSLASYDNVAGNHYDKYNTTNPVARLLMRGFLAGFDRLVAQSGAQQVFEVGCGEGHLSLRMEATGLVAHGVDLEAVAVAEARANAEAAGATARFHVADLYTLSPERHAAELIVSCEVLEHVPDPERALQVLTGLARPWLLVSVPREPVWRVLNMARGRYLGDFGNTPGHIQHWSAGGFERLVSRHARIVARARPLPWTMLLCRCD